MNTQIRNVPITGQVGLVNQADRETQVGSQMKELDRATQRLMDMTLALEHRLQPVLNLADQPEVAGPKAEPVLVPMADQLKALIRRIDDACDFLGRIRERVEL